MDSRTQLDAYALSAEKRALLELLLEEEGLTRSEANPIVPRDDPNAPAPLSYAQQWMWLLNQLYPHSPAYNESTSVRLTGPLNVDVLERSFNELVRRHEILRTIFTIVDGEPVQIVQDTVNLSLTLVDLSAQPEAEQETQLHQLVTDEFQQLFDLGCGPLLRIKLLQLDGTTHILLLTMHHIISDAWSMDVIFKELAAIYDAFCHDRACPLPELPIQYADFAQWQQQWQHDEALQPHLEYWKQQLGGRLPVLDLPTDHPRPSMKTFQGARHYVALPNALHDSLKAVTHGEGLTLFMTLLASFQVLLYRYTGQDDFLVGSPIAGRNQPSVEGLIGCFLNTLVLRADVAGNPKFRDLLGRVREMVLTAYEHQDLPLANLVEELQPERELSRNPLFQIMFVFQNAQLPELPGLSLSPVQFDKEAAKLDLTLSIEETPQGLSGWWEYNRSLFDATTIARIAGHFLTLLEAIAADPDQRVLDLPLLTEAERHQLLVTWNDTQAHYPRQVCMHQLFEAQVEQTPDAVAVVYEDTQLTYQELNRRANQLAHRLCGLGVGPDVPVGLCVERSLQIVIGLLGILKAGGAYVPLQPDAPRARLAFILEDANVPILLTQQHLIADLPTLDAQVVSMDEEAEVHPRESEHNPVSGVSGQNAAYVLYTSGSTGRPKGVLITHDQIRNYAQGIWETLQLEPGMTFAMVQPLTVDSSQTVIFPAFMGGGCLHVISQETALDPWALSDYFRDHPIDLLKIAPSHLATLQHAADAASLLPRRRLIIGGEASQHDWVTSLQTQTDCTIFNHYGPTETTVGILTYRFPSATAGHQTATVPVGRPLPNSQAYVLDRHGHPVPIGVPGELYLGGHGLARGYYNRAELTADRFIPNPFGQASSSGTRLYKTGDLARYLPDGNLEFLGRLDDQVKVRGFRIELGEIEMVLAGHPEIQETIVTTYQDPAGAAQLVAYIVASQADAVPTPQTLSSFLKEYLPEYMVPTAFVTLDALPLTPHGKIDRQALPEPDTSRSEPEQTFVAPRDALEYQIAKIWEQVLGIQPIGSQDNFFELGGHSLMAVRMLAQMEKVSGRKLPLVTLFQAPTVEHLADTLRQDTWVAPWNSLVPIQPAGSQPPFFCMHAAAGNVLFYSDLPRYLGSDQPVYGLQARGLDGSEAPLTRVEDMAEHYIEEIRTIQPEGPYFLSGLSFGGIIAFEMAQQLTAQGQTVALLVLFDTHGPGYPSISRFRAVRDRAAHLGRRIQNNLSRYRRIQSQEKGAFALAKVRNVAARSQRRNKHWLNRIRETFERAVYQVYRVSRRPLPPALRYLYVREVNIQAVKAYQPKAYPGAIALFRASDQPPGCKPDPQLGWGKVALGGVKIYELPGSHSQNLIREPRAQIVVEKLQGCLSETQSVASEL